MWKNGLLGSNISYKSKCDGPISWNAYRDNGNEEIEVRKTSNGLTVRFFDSDGDFA